MKPYYQDADVAVYEGDCVQVMHGLPDGSVDAVVTDPPYGIRFMGKAWDGADIVKRQQADKLANPVPRSAGGTNGGYRSLAAEAGRYNQSADATRAFQAWCEEWASECFRLLKPGGYFLAFGSPRTWHRLVTAVEDCGFEIRDTIAWLYGSGFPKSRNLTGEWDGWGTGLKPGHEPIVVARKPFGGTVAANVLEHGTGALNIDACRVPTDDVLTGSGSAPMKMSGANHRPFHDTAGPLGVNQHSGGRWPTNVVLSHAVLTDPETCAVLDDACVNGCVHGCPVTDLDAQSGVLHSGTMRAGSERQPRAGGTIYGADSRTFNPADTYGDSGGASRFFPTFRYEAKAPTNERPQIDGAQHPTVKPLALMQWLVRLVCRQSGTVLDLFGGSGTTGEACVIEGINCILIEEDENYLPLIVQRLSKDINLTLNLDGLGA